MREISFRGRELDDAYGLRWVYGDLTHVWGSPHIARVLIDESTLGQFTGLRDADGVDIYEGDVLQKREELAWRTVVRGSVFWNSAECRWSVKMRDGLVFSLTSRKSDTWRVIGNVHDSPELLEVSNGRL